MRFSVSQIVKMLESDGDKAVINGLIQERMRRREEINITKELIQNKWSDQRIVKALSAAEFGSEDLVIILKKESWEEKRIIKAVFDAFSYKHPLLKRIILLDETGENIKTFFEILMENSANDEKEKELSLYQIMREMLEAQWQDKVITKFVIVLKKTRKLKKLKIRDLNPLYKKEIKKILKEVKIKA